MCVSSIQYSEPWTAIQSFRRSGRLSLLIVFPNNLKAYDSAEILYDPCLDSLIRYLGQYRKEGVRKQRGLTQLHVDLTRGSLGAVTLGKSRLNTALDRARVRVLSSSLRISISRAYKIMNPIVIRQFLELTLSRIAASCYMNQSCRSVRILLPLRLENVPYDLKMLEA